MTPYVLPSLSTMWLERERTRRTIVTLCVEAQAALRAAERPEGPGRLPNERQRSWAQRILYVLRKEQGSLRVTQGGGRDQLWRRGKGWRGQERSELRNLGMK